MHKTIGFIAICLVLVCLIVFAPRFDDDTHTKFGLITEYLQEQNSINKTQLLTNQAILERLNCIEAELRLSEEGNRGQDEMIRAMSQFDFSTTKALCDRIAKLEAALIK